MLKKWREKQKKLERKISGKNLTKKKMAENKKWNKKCRGKIEKIKSQEKVTEKNWIIFLKNAEEKKEKAKIEGQKSGKNVF